MLRINGTILRRMANLGRLTARPILTQHIRTFSEEVDQPLIIRPHFDYKAIVANLDAIRASMLSRNYTSVDLDEIVELAQERFNLQSEVFTMRMYRNNVATRMQQINSKRPSMDPAPAMIGTIPDEIDLSQASILDLIAEGKRIKAEISVVESKLEEVEAVLERLAAKLPNLNHPDVPIGDESKAALLAHNNPSKATIEAFAAKGFVPKDHLDIAREHKLVDLEAAAKVTGSRFYYLMREAALLEMALINYSMQKLVSKGFIPVLSPDLSKTAVVEGAGFQSKDEKTLDQHVYQITNSDLSLVATAEIPMAGRFLNEILPEAQLPIKTVAFSHCFRTEAGRGGSQVKGLYRVHQFSKVEMFVVCAPHQAEALHQEIIDIEKEIFSELGLNYRVLDMPTLDLGAPAHRKVDIEACMPGRAISLRRSAIANEMLQHGGKQDVFKNLDHILSSVEDLQGVEDAWGEISSASNCTDYQARRLNIRYKPEVAPEEGGTTRFAYTLNGTACAVPRMIIAILEQNQRADGTVEIPDVLRPFMMGNVQIPFANRMF